MTGTTRDNDGKVYSVFIAGAEDCAKLREIALQAFEVINRPPPATSMKFTVFDWKRHKSAGHMEGEFQDKVFEDAAEYWGKEHCDIMVLILWYKFGENTKKEYDYYMKKKEDGCVTKLLVCHYNQQVSPLELRGANIDQLFAWVDSVRSDWAEISSERGTVRDPVEFSQEITRQIYTFLKEPSDE